MKEENKKTMKEKVEDAAHKVKEKAHDVKEDVKRGIDEAKVKAHLPKTTWKTKPKKLKKKSLKKLMKKKQNTKKQHKEPPGSLFTSVTV